MGFVIFLAVIAVAVFFYIKHRDRVAAENELLVQARKAAMATSTTSVPVTPVTPAVVEDDGQNDPVETVPDKPKRKSRAKTVVEDDSPRVVATDTFTIVDNTPSYVDSTPVFTSPDPEPAFHGNGGDYGGGGSTGSWGSDSSSSSSDSGSSDSGSSGGSDGGGGGGGGD